MLAKGVGRLATLAHTRSAGSRRHLMLNEILSRSLGELRSTIIWVMVVVDMTAGQRTHMAELQPAGTQRQQTEAL